MLHVRLQISKSQSCKSSKCAVRTDVTNYLYLFPAAIGSNRSMNTYLIGRHYSNTPYHINSEKSRSRAESYNCVALCPRKAFKGCRK